MAQITDYIKETELLEQYNSYTYRDMAGKLKAYFLKDEHGVWQDLTKQRQDIEALQQKIANTKKKYQKELEEEYGQKQD